MRRTVRSAERSRRRVATVTWTIETTTSVGRQKAATTPASTASSVNFGQGRLPDVDISPVSSVSSQVENGAVNGEIVSTISHTAKKLAIRVRRTPTIELAGNIYWQG